MIYRCRAVLAAGAFPMPHLTTTRTALQITDSSPVRHTELPTKYAYCARTALTFYDMSAAKSSAGRSQANISPPDDLKPIFPARS